MDRQAFLVMASHLQRNTRAGQTEDRHTGLGLSSQSPASTFSRSGNFVAPSASAMRMSFPLELIVPCKFDRDKWMVKSLTHVHALTPTNRECNASVIPSSQLLLCPCSSPVSGLVLYLHHTSCSTALQPGGTQGDGRNNWKGGSQVNISIKKKKKSRIN